MYCYPMGTQLCLESEVQTAWLPGGMEFKNMPISIVCFFLRSFLGPSIFAKTWPLRMASSCYLNGVYGNIW